MCRFWQGYTVSYFALQYFNIYQRNKLYSTLNALGLFMGGFGSNLLAGILSDKFEAKDSRTKALICTYMSMLAVPLLLIVFLVQESFALSMAFLITEYTLCEGWIPPSITMIQGVVGLRYKGVVVGVFLFCVNMSGTAAASIVGKINNSYAGPDGTTDPHTLGTIMALATAIPCALASVCYYIAGNYYKEWKY